MKSQTTAAAVFLAALALATPAPARTVSAAYEGEQKAETDAAVQLLFGGDPKRAEQAFSRIIKHYQDRYRAKASYRCSINADHAKDLAASLETTPGELDIVILGPDWCTALWGKGFTLVDLGRGDQAEPFLAQSVEMAPHDAHYRNEYAEWYKSRRDWNRALLEFSLAWDVVSHDPKGPDRTLAARALRGMGFAKIELGQLDEAEALFRKSLEFEPDSRAAANELEYIAQQRSNRPG
ncbi:MAG TPA: tetratricopeptide repeat protein [Novosphingobium sp.]|nr:tetratricopeptide repeat protein [Novosphingobium sp.]